MKPPQEPAGHRTDRANTVSPWKRVWANRRKAAPLVLGIAVLVVGTQVMNARPVETQVSFRLGPRHADIAELRVEYKKEGQFMKAAAFRFTPEEPAPEAYRHSVELPRGRYVVVARAMGRSGEELGTGSMRFDTHSESVSVVHIKTD